MQNIYWFRELIDVKAPWAEHLNYGELLTAGFPIPTGFVIPPGIKGEIQKQVGIDDISRISPSSIPESIRREIVNSYFKMNASYDYSSLPAEAKELVGRNTESNLVLVKSAGKAYPNVRGTGELLEAVLKCLSLGRGPVIVQKMISPEKAGVLITSKNGDISIEATYGFASPIIRKEVEADTYLISKHSGDIKDKRLGSKATALMTNIYNRTIERITVDEARRNSYVLNEREIEVICKLASLLESHLSRPQKAIWAITKRRVYLLETEDYKQEFNSFTESKPEASPFGALATPAVETGPTHNDMFSPPEEKVTELPQPALDSWESFESKPADTPIADNLFSSDFSGGMDLFDNPAEPAKQESHYEPPHPAAPEPSYPAPPQYNEQSYAPPEPRTNYESGSSATTIKLGVSLTNPSYASSIASYEPAVVSLRVEDFFAVAGVHPNQVNQIGPLAYADRLAGSISQTIAGLGNIEVIITLSDLRSDKFGGNERNPLLGHRGARKLNSQVLDLEFSALSKIAMRGPSFKLALPFVTSASELKRAEDMLYRYNASSIELGAVIETPAAVSTIDKLCEHAKFVLINADSLAELMLAVDRTNDTVKSLYDINHEAVRNAVSGVVKICKSKRVKVYVAGDALGNRDFLSFVKEQGADAIIVNSDSFNNVKSQLSSNVQGGYGQDYSRSEASWS